ncbi:MAG: iron-sulfur cluster assembly protein [Desulfobacteraceae bacterium]|nr:MAG: iron-sulfur cluster assembly protein [Desulfobacteraceae bacterium]
MEKAAMEKDPSIEDVRAAITKVMHPAIDLTLMDLGMIQDIALTGNNASLTMVIPFPGIPILSFLEKSLKESVKPLGIDLKIKIEHMNQEEIQNFLAMEKEAWKGL